jgi:uncharacterized protein (DUF58 family)
VTSVRLRKRAGGLVLGAVVLFLIGTNVQAGMLFVLSGLLVGAVLAGIALPFVALRGLRAELTAPIEAMQGEPAIVDLALLHTGRGVRWSVLAADAHLEQAEVFLPVVRPGGRAEVTTMRTPARRGPASTGWVEVRSAAPFGVAERRRRLPVQAETLVLPRVFPLGSLAFVEPVPTYETGIHARPRHGHGPDFLGVREYRPGDPMRHVHWGLTARHGQIMVREFEEERTRRLAIVVDTECDEGDVWTPLDRACSVAASVLDAALAVGHGARLAAGTSDGTDVLARADRDELHRWLAALTPSGRSLVEVLRDLEGTATRGAGTVVVATPLWPRTDLRAVADAASALRVGRVVLVAVQPADAPAPAAVDGVELRVWREGEDLSAALGAEVMPA